MVSESVVQNINIDSIIPNRFQPRITFDEKALNELASSIKEHGIIQPLVLRKINDKYEIIAGERRYKAAQIAGLTEVPAIITNMDDTKSAEIALVENIQRQNLNSLEEAKSYNKILVKENLTQEQLAQKMGVSQSTIANKLRLLNLSPDVQDALIQNQISERHARSLLSVSDEIKQKELLEKIIKERLTVRQLDEEIKKINQNNNFETLETLEDITDKKESTIINIFDKLNKETNTFDMESSVANMNITDQETEEPVEETPIIEKEIKEELQAAPEPIIIPKTSIIEPDNIESVKLAYKNFVKEIEEAGYKVNSEDFDFEDLYQIIIKIEKQVE